MPVEGKGEPNNRVVDGFPVGDVTSLKIGRWKTVCSELDTFCASGQETESFHDAFQQVPAEVVCPKIEG